MGKVAAAREATKQETRDALIAAGTAEFAENGLDAPSLDTICARAGYTRGAFYVHFRDREDLLVAVVDRMLTRFHDAVIAGNEAEGLEQTVARYIAAVARGAPEVGGKGKWQFHNTLDACARSSVLRERYVALQQQAIERVTRAARAGQRAGTVRRDVPARAIGEILVVLTLGVGAMVELSIPFDLGGGGDAIARLLRVAGAK
ncbi:MAG TPA: TetR/AcrR family transcriptional regulator [Polyangiaceae bacterium]|jgi:AcrR family transcriptional regulator